MTSWISLHSLHQEIVFVRGQLHVSGKHRFHLIWEVRETSNTPPISGSPDNDGVTDVFGLQFMAAAPGLMQCWYLMMFCPAKADASAVQPCWKRLAMLNVNLIIHPVALIAK